MKSAKKNLPKKKGDGGTLLFSKRKLGGTKSVLKGGKRKKSRSYLKRKADAIFSLIIRTRGKCEMCGRSQGVQLQCAHVYSRRYLHLRYFENNALALCAGCHRWAHDNPIDFSDWFQGVYQERYLILQEAKNVIEHTLDYEQLIINLEARWAEIIKYGQKTNL